jgi:hypothetical protein
MCVLLGLGLVVSVARNLPADAMHDEPEHKISE